MRADCRTGLTVQFFIDRPFWWPDHPSSHFAAERVAEMVPPTRAGPHVSLVVLAHALARQFASEHMHSTSEVEG